MKCSLCGYQFREDEGRATCSGCPLNKPCHMVKCPNCGYDIPLEPRITKALKAWRDRNHGTERKS